MIGQHFVELWTHVYQFLYPRGYATDILAVPEHAARIAWSRDLVDQTSQASVLCTTMASPWLIAMLCTTMASPWWLAIQQHDPSWV